MMIRRLTASFGKLQNDSLSFHEGLNVIYAPNESGKSTWCAFIRTMLYGVDSAQRTKNGVLPDKEKYAPWSGAPMEGTMELNALGSEITLTRTSKGKNTPMRELSAVYTGTDIPPEGITAQNAGEMLTGVTKEVFRRSAFVEQGSIALSGTPELEKRINAIVSTGEESISYTEADATLREWQRKRRYHQRGALPELEARLDEDRAALLGLEELVKKSEKIEEELESSRRRCEELEAEVNESRRQQRSESRRKLSTGRAAFKTVEQVYAAANAERTEVEERLKEHFFGELSPEEARESAERDIRRLGFLRETEKRSFSPAPMLLCFAFALVGMALYFFAGQVLYLASALLFVLTAAAMGFLFFRNRKQARKAGRRRRELLKQYGATSIKDIRRLLAEHEALYDEFAEKSALEQEARAAFDHAEEEKERLEATVLDELDFVSGSSEAAEWSRRLSAERRRAEELSAQTENIRGRLTAAGDPLVIASEIGSMEREYEEISDEYDAITLAIETLKSADTEIQSRFSPRLGKLAAEYMSEMTGGRYEDVFVSRDFHASMRANGESVARPSAYLSAGTVDLLYLALRLAVCELALPEGESCPLIIDDALVNLDEERSAQAMTLLGKLAEKRQIILFTCRKQDIL